MYVCMYVWCFNVWFCICPFSFSKSWNFYWRLCGLGRFMRRDFLSGRWELALYWRQCCNSAISIRCPILSSSVLLLIHSNRSITYVCMCLGQVGGSLQLSDCRVRCDGGDRKAAWPGGGCHAHGSALCAACRREQSHWNGHAKKLLFFLKSRFPRESVIFYNLIKFYL